MEKLIYTDIIYKYGYNNPLELKFKSEFMERRITLSGEGGNRHIKIMLDDGWVDLWIDTHVYGGKYFAFIAPGMGITCIGNPNIKRVIDLMHVISQTCDKVNLFYWFAKEQINRLFTEICERV